jgi:hypothetical protein
VLADLGLRLLIDPGLDLDERGDVGIRVLRECVLLG